MKYLSVDLCYIESLQAEVIINQISKGKHQNGLAKARYSMLCISVGVSDIIISYLELAILS